MKIERQESNPFDLIKASDFTDAEIYEFWVDLSGEHGGLENLIKPRLVTPMLLLGGKGSGKTHLMRYFSAPVQAARYEGDLRKAVLVDKYLGIYVRAEGLNAHRFAGKGQDDETWAAIFATYFELWLAINLLTNAEPLLAPETSDEMDRRGFSQRASRLFDIDVSSRFDSVTSLLGFLNELKRNIDFKVNNAALSRKIDGLQILFSPGKLVFGLPDLIKGYIEAPIDTLFVYLIDELENFSVDQQKFINTLIRYRQGNTSIKIGARLYGIRTYETLGVGEPIKRDAEYDRVELDGFLRDHSQEYSAFCTKLIINRLNQFAGKSQLSQDTSLSSNFAEIDASDNFKKLALGILQTWNKPDRTRPYFERLRRQVETNYKGSEGLYERLYQLLKIDHAPFVEKVSLLHLYRAWTDNESELIRRAEGISAQARAFVDNDANAAGRYGNVLSHFRSDLLSQLFRDASRESPYAGFQTIIHLSQGIPRNLLGILKHVYRRSLFAGEKPFAGGQISIESQSRGVMDSAAWFWEDAQPDSDGAAVREGVEALAVLFRTMRYSERPPECDCATFSVRTDALTRESLHTLETAEKWSYLIRIRDGASDKNSQVINTKYQLGPMLAPKWGISEHRRGSIELSPELANAMFDSAHRAALKNLFKRRVEGYLASEFTRRKSVKQDQLPLC